MTPTHWGIAAAIAVAGIIGWTILNSNSCNYQGSNSTPEAFDCQFHKILRSN